MAFDPKKWQQLDQAKPTAPQQTYDFTIDPSKSVGSIKAPSKLNPLRKVEVRPPLAAKPQTIRGGSVIGGITNFASRIVEDSVVGGIKSFATLKSQRQTSKGQTPTPVNLPFDITYQRGFDDTPVTQRSFTDQATSALKRIEELDKKNPDKRRRNLLQGAAEEVFFPVLDAVDLLGLGEIGVRGARQITTSKPTRGALKTLGLGTFDDVSEAGVKSKLETQVQKITRKVEKGKIAPTEGTKQLNKMREAVDSLSNTKQSRFGRVGEELRRASVGLTEERGVRKTLQQIKSSPAGLSLKNVGDDVPTPRGRNAAEEAVAKGLTEEQFVKGQEQIPFGQSFSLTNKLTRGGVDQFPISKTHIYHGTDPLNVVKILSSGELSPRISQFDEARQRVVSLSKSANIAETQGGQIVFEISNKKVKSFDAPRGVIKGDSITEGFEIRSTSPVKLRDVDGAIIYIKKGETLQTAIQDVQRIDRFGNTKIVDVDTFGGIKKKLEDAGIGVLVRDENLTTSQLRADYQAAKGASVTPPKVGESSPNTSNLSDAVTEAKWEHNPGKARQQAHKAVVAKYSGVDVDNTKVSTAHSDISNLPPVTNIPRKALKFGETNTRIDFPEETWFQRRVSNLQDDAHRLGFLQKKLRERGVVITEEMDAYLQQEALIGRASARVGKLHDDLGLNARSKDGLFRRMRKDEILVDGLSEFLTAKNARTRNARVAKLTEGKVPDGGSGMTNKEADAILKKYEGNTKMEGYGKEYRKLVIDERLKVLKESGLYTDEQIKLITAGEPNYMPAKVSGKTSSQGSTAGGRMGSSFQRLKGSARTDRTNSVMQAVADLETTITRAETNKMRLSLKRLIEEVPDDSLWEVRKVRHAPTYNKNGEVEFLKPLRKASEADNTIEVFENGKAFDIVIHDDALARVFTKNGQKKPIESLMRINNYLRAVNTFINPEFIMTNAIRDVQTALVIAGGEKGGKVAAGMVRDYPKASAGIWKAVRKNSKDGWSGIYNEMVDAGGRTGWFDLMEVEERTRKTSRLIEKYNSTKTSDSLGRAYDSVGQVLMDANEVAEMSVRVSAYKQLRDGGMSTAKAANYVKNMTVNFNKHGNVGLLINSLYLFANAGIQGNVRLITSLRYPKVRRIVAGIAASTYAINELNMMTNPEGYSRVQDFEKQRKLIVMLPKDGNKYNIPGVKGDPRNGYYLSVPLPYGFNIFKVAGDVAYDTVNKKKTPAESMATLLGAVDASFNPLSSGTGIQLASPTFLDPAVAAFENKNWFGAPIMPEQPAFAPPVKESSRYFSGARDISVGVADWLNRNTGGNEVTSGLVDVSPEILDHIIDTLGGGLGNFVAQTVDGTISTIKGDVPTFDEMPFVRKLIDRPYETGELSNIYELLDRSATQNLSPIETDRFIESSINALELGQIDLSTTKRNINTLTTNKVRQYAGEIKSLLDEGNIDKALEVLGSAPEGITKELTKLIQDDLEKEIKRLKARQK